MDPLDMILGASLGALVWLVHQLRDQIAAERRKARQDAAVYYDAGRSHTWKSQERDASGRFA